VLKLRDKIKKRKKAENAKRITEVESKNTIGFLTNFPFKVERLENKLEPANQQNKIGELTIK
jgi:hypothetical protein